MSDLVRLPCISLWQPWATLWLLDQPRVKEYETRPKASHYIGPQLVHAAQYRGREVKAALSDPVIIRALRSHGFVPESLPYGALVGLVGRDGSRRMSSMLLQPSELERQMGNWLPRRYALIGRAPRFLPVPIPWKGKQGTFYADVQRDLLDCREARAYRCQSCGITSAWRHWKAVGGGRCPLCLKLYDAIAAQEGDD